MDKSNSNVDILTKEELLETKNNIFRNLDKIGRIEFITDNDVTIKVEPPDKDIISFFFDSDQYKFVDVKAVFIFDYLDVLKALEEEEEE